MWGQKTDDWSIHDKDNLYECDVAMGEWLSEVNGWSGDGSTRAGLGGHADWRIPASAELQTIVDCGLGPPCIDPIFGPTQDSVYWSSTTDAYDSNRAWCVASFGLVAVCQKHFHFNARAVRGGL